jgi:hypothetical protein
MTNLRDNLNWLIGSIATAIAMVVGWLISSGVVVNLLFLLIGFGITYFVQTRTQKKAWKREYSVKIAEQVYGALFRDTKNLIRSLENKYYQWISFEGWRQVQEDHRYFMVDEKFRERLDQFSDRVERYSRAVMKLRNEILSKIVFEETERCFGTKVNEVPRFNVSYMCGYKHCSTSPDLINCLISQIHPIEDVKRYESEIFDLECIIEIKSIDAKITHLPYLTEGEEFWESCLRRMKEDKTYKFIIEKNEELLEEARQVKKEIIKGIEEPWKI